MCNQYHNLVREYRVKEVDINGEIEYHIEYYYDPFPITNEYIIKIRIWRDIITLKNKKQAEEMCNLYQVYANRHLIK